MVEPQWLDDWSDELDPREYPNEKDFDDEDDEITCPECGTTLYGDLDKCWSCGHDIIDDRNIWTGRPAWWIILGVLGIISVIWAMSL